MARFNWYILAACAVLFMVAGFACGAAAIILSGHVFLGLFSAAMSAGMFICSGLSLNTMERF